MENSIPSREVLRCKLEEVSSGAVARSDVASWAMAIILDDNVRVTDWVAWKVLKQLGAADLPAPDREYLYQAEDFDAWRAELLSD